MCHCFVRTCSAEQAARKHVICADRRGGALSRPCAKWLRPETLRLCMLMKALRSACAPCSCLPAACPAAPTAVPRCMHSGCPLLGPGPRRKTVPPWSVASALNLLHSMNVHWQTSLGGRLHIVVEHSCGSSFSCMHAARSINGLHVLLVWAKKVYLSATGVATQTHVTICQGGKYSE